MEIKIEDYRGFEITFNTNTEEFVSISDYFDTQINKKSYASTKKAIDECIKANNEFKPVWVERGDGYGEKRIKLIGIRKDKRFIYENEKGEKGQLSEWDEKYYYLINPKNDILYKKIDELEKEIDKLRLEQRETENQLLKEELGLKGIKMKYSF